MLESQALLLVNSEYVVNWKGICKNVFLEDAEMTGFFIFTVILHCEILFRHCFAFSSHLTFLLTSIALNLRV